MLRVLFGLAVSYIIWHIILWCLGMGINLHTFILFSAGIVCGGLTGLLLYFTHEESEEFLHHHYNSILPFDADGEPPPVDRPIY